MNRFPHIRGPRMIRMAFFLRLVFLPLEMFAQAVRIGIEVDKPLKDTIFARHTYTLTGKIIFPFLMSSDQYFT